MSRRSSAERDPQQTLLEFESERQREARLLGTLLSLGFTALEEVRLTRNRSTMVSLVGHTLRVHHSFADAPAEVLRAIVTFFSRRRSPERSAARKIILQHAGPQPAGPPRRRRNAAEDEGNAARLTRAHAELNERHFNGALSVIEPLISGRMKRRLGHYAPAAAGRDAEIVISRRHIRRNGWDAARTTLLHEMVHQWQDESGLALNHGRHFRAKAREVGIVAGPVAPRVVDSGAQKMETGKGVK